MWAEAKKERNPIFEKYPMVYHARHTRWSVHSSWRTTADITKLDDIGQPLLELTEVLFQILMLARPQSASDRGQLWLQA